MARVIKGGGGKQVARRPAKLAVGTDRKVIDKEVYRAQQKAAELIEAAEAEKDRILADGQKKANQAREEAQSEGAAEAFAEAAAEALAAFRRRAERFTEAAEDIRILALEVAQKIIGRPLKLEEDEIGQLVTKGLAGLRARRKLRVQMPPDRHQALLAERPRLMAALDREPDLFIESVDDVSPGFARVVTEVGGALCSEQVALDALAEAVEVDEQATAPAPQSALNAITGVGERPPGLAAALEDSELASAFASDEELYEDGDFDDDDDEATAFIPAQSASAAYDSEETDVKMRRPARQSRRRRGEPSVEATMALDVSDLRKDLTRGSQVDGSEEELDLFADDSVLD